MNDHRLCLLKPQTARPKRPPNSRRRRCQRRRRREEEPLREFSANVGRIAITRFGSRAPTRLPVGVGGVETGFLEAGDRKESFGPIPVQIEATVPKL